MGASSLNSSLNSSFVSSTDTSSPPQGQPLHSKAIHNSLEHNFMTKPSKWLSLTQQHMYSSHRSNQANYQQEQELVDQRCSANSAAATSFLANASNVLGNYGECDFFKMAAKKSDFNSNHNHNNK
jgi:hypothetical protein